MKTAPYIQQINAAEFNGQPLTATPALELALHSAMPEGVDQKSNEIMLGGYSRVRVESTPENWSVEGVIVKNRAEVSFATITRGKAQAVCLSFGVGGIIRRVLVLETPITLAENRRVEFPAGSIQIVEAA